MKKRGEFKEKIYTINHPNAIPTTFAQKAADKLTNLIGSWTFIILFLVLIGIWIFTILYISKSSLESLELDPFLLLNLVLSCIAAIQAPIILMSQNRANQKDRHRMDYDYLVDKKSEKEIEQIKVQLNRMERKLNEKR